MVATQRGPGRPTLSSTRFHSWPPSRLTWTAPSSVPTQSTSGFRGDSASAVAEPRFVRVISGEIGFNSSPCLSERNTMSPPT